MLPSCGLNILSVRILRTSNIDRPEEKSIIVNLLGLNNFGALKRFFGLLGWRVWRDTAACMATIRTRHRRDIDFHDLDAGGVLETDTSNGVMNTVPAQISSLRDGLRGVPTTPLRTQNRENSSMLLNKWVASLYNRAVGYSWMRFALDGPAP